MSGLWLAVTIFAAVSGGASVGLLIGCMLAASSRARDLDLDLTYLSRSER